MIVYLYFNFYYFNNPQFMYKLKMCNSRYAISTDDDDSIEVHLEEDRYPFCRMKLIDENSLTDLIKEFKHEIYKYILYP